MPYASSAFTAAVYSSAASVYGPLPMPNRCQPSPNSPSFAQSVAGAPTPTIATQ